MPSGTKSNVMLRKTEVNLATPNGHPIRWSFLQKIKMPKKDVTYFMFRLNRSFKIKTASTAFFWEGQKLQICVLLREKMECVFMICDASSSKAEKAKYDPHF